MQNTTNLVVYESRCNCKIQNIARKGRNEGFLFALNNDWLSRRYQMSDKLSKTTDDKTNLNWIEVVRKQVSSLRFGVVQITVHDSRVVQVETTERLRFDKPETQ